MNAFDHTVAQNEGNFLRFVTLGYLIPYHGVESDYDEIVQRIEDSKAEFNSYLEEQKKKLRYLLSPYCRCGNLEYKHIGKELYQLETPKSVIVPSSFIKLSQTKTTNRYWSPELKRMAREWDELQEIRSNILRDLQKKIFKKFDQNYREWFQATQIVAEIDCIMSLTSSKSCIGGD